MGFGDNLKKLVTSAAKELDKLQDMAEQQRTNQSARKGQKDLDAERGRDAEIRGLPTAQVQLTASGWTTGQWSGQMHYGWNEISADSTGKALLWFELFAPTGEEPELGGHRLRHWSFQIYGWAKDGTYDLATICREREANGWTTQYLEWAMTFTDVEDSKFYFTPAAGPASVTVSDGTKRFSVSISATCALGDLTLAAEITRS